MRDFSFKMTTGQIWSVGLFQSPPNIDIFSHRTSNPSYVFSPLTYRDNGLFFHTLADPFLTIYNGKLFLFFEAQRRNGIGEIHAASTTDLINWDFYGCILKENYHLSFPSVYCIKENYFLIPESSEDNSIKCYKCLRFPDKWIFEKTILDGIWLDPVLFFWGEKWYLWATSPDYQLFLFYSDDFYGEWKQHPGNPVSMDKKFSRNAGIPLNINGSLFRIAQDCQNSYGEKLHIIKVTHLSETEYGESLFREDFLPKGSTWNYLGGHHLSVVCYNGQMIIATDGKSRMNFFNRLRNYISDLYG